MDVQIRASPQPLDRLVDDFLGFRRALIRHHFIRILSGRPRRARRRPRQECRKEKYAPIHPHRIAPPFTLITSPVMKVARSEAAKRIGPAISSARAGRFSGIAALANFELFFERSTAADMSVSTHPGATQFTRILCRASSVANPFTKLIIAPLLAP